MSDPTSETRKTILVVDDNPEILPFMRVVLESAGYGVETTTGGEHALALLKERPADLLITDIFMPEQDGIETLWQVKGRFPQTRIITMSAGAAAVRQHDYLASAAVLGVNATLRKPFTADDLLDTVRKVFDSQR